MQTKLIIQNPDSALFYYGFGSIISSVLLTSFYYLYFYFHKKENREEIFFIKSFKDLLLKPTSPYLDDQILDEIFKSMKKQISIRLLTDGNKYLITMFSLISNEDQGIYSIVCLVGMIFSRLIFSSIESMNFRSIFSSIRCQSNESLMLNCRNLFEKLLRFWMILSMLFVLFISPYFSSINLGKNSMFIWYLRLYLIEIFLNGINVCQQSFLRSILSNEQRNCSENRILLFSFISLIFSFFFIRLFGICGIILMNSFHLIGRISINYSLMIRYTKRINWHFFSSNYVFFIFVLMILFHLNGILIANSFGQMIFCFGLILIIFCLTMNEEKELIHYFYCIWKLNQFFE